MDKRKEEDVTFLRKKAEEKQNGIIIMTSVDEKRTIFEIVLEIETGREVV